MRCALWFWDGTVQPVEALLPVLTAPPGAFTPVSAANKVRARVRPGGRAGVGCVDKVQRALCDDGC